MSLLFDGVPLWIEVVLVLWIALFIGTYVGSAYWVYRDATTRGATYPRLSAIWSLLPFGIFGYLYNRSGLGEREIDLSTGEKSILALVVAVNLAFFLGAVVSPLDPFTQVIYATGFLFPMLLTSYVLFFRGGYARLKNAVSRS